MKENISYWIWERFVNKVDISSPQNLLRDFPGDWNPHSENDDDD